MTSINIQRQATPSRGPSNAPVLSGFLVLLTATVLLWNASASAQLSGKGEIKGVVTDSSGAVVPGATVTATSTTQDSKLSRTTSSSGDFDLTPLNPDVYRITVAATGSPTLTQETLHGNALEVAALTLILTVDAERQSIDLPADQPP